MLNGSPFLLRGLWSLTAAFFGTTFDAAAFLRFTPCFAFPGNGVISRRCSKQPRVQHSLLRPTSPPRSTPRGGGGTPRVCVHHDGCGGNRAGEHLDVPPTPAEGEIFIKSHAHAHAHAAAFHP